MSDFTSTLLASGGIGAGSGDIAPEFTDAGIGSGGPAFDVGGDAGDAFADAIQGDQFGFPSVGGVDFDSSSPSKAPGRRASYKKLLAVAVAAAGAAAGVHKMQPQWAIDKRTGRVSQAAMVAVASGAAMVAWGALSFAGM